ncbi:hypothetical protein [Lysinibacillus parviboronicapiens]|uniref:hypothetical protein n=1 Tax=Lysinibacillus parviboronicapiens TaxID=436516 RepID=UPI00187D4F58|nr:hypothetical protein [Lysinibacillus parviboronicapiens]
MEKEGKDSFERWEVENCAEIQAVNQAFKEEAKLEDIKSVQLWGNTNPLHSRFPCISRITFSNRGS